MYGYNAVISDREKNRKGICGKKHKSPGMFKASYVCKVNVIRTKTYYRNLVIHVKVLEQRYY